MNAMTLKGLTRRFSHIARCCATQGMRKHSLIPWSIAAPARAASAQTILKTASVRTAARPDSRRHDEVGTPLVITVDFETIEGDGSVTLRDRDTMAQTRCAKEEIADVVGDYYRGG